MLSLLATVCKNVAKSNGLFRCNIVQVRYRTRKRPRIIPWLERAEMDTPTTDIYANLAPPQLKFEVRRKRRDMNAKGGQEARLNKLRKMVTALVRYERLEGSYAQTSEIRLYAERLIQEALVHGDRHKKTMLMADYWLLEKDLIHKLFKVLVPRYQQYTSSYTRVFKLQPKLPGFEYPRAVLELRGNPYPPVQPYPHDNSKLLTNVLINGLRRDFMRRKAQKGTSGEEEIVDGQEERGDGRGEEGEENDMVQTDEGSIQLSPQIINDLARIKLGKVNIFDASEKVQHSVKDQVYKDLTP